MELLINIQSQLSEQPALLLVPLIGAIIGWLTNLLAVKMLFHPRKPIPLLFFSVQGVFPKRQAALAKKLGEIVSTELISVSEVTSHLKDKAGSDEILNLLGDKIEHVITNKLPEVIPMISMVLNDELVGTVRTAFLENTRDMIPDLIDHLSGTLEADLSVHRIVEEKVANFSSEKLEQILFSIMRREFHFIEFIGAVLGFLIGMVQVVIVVGTAI